MIPVYSTSQVREIDEYAITHLKIPSLILMENAALEIFHFIMNANFHFGINPSVGIICGKGNNGGDGFAVARQLSNAGFNVKVLHTHLADQMSADCRTNFQILQNLKSINKNISIKKINSVKDVQSIRNSDLIIDAVFGSGFSGDLKDPYDKIIRRLNDLKSIKIAIDIPSGLNSDNGFTKLAFKSDFTITLGELKQGLFFNFGPLYCGEVIKGNIGVSEKIFDSIIPAAYLIEPEDALQSLPVKIKNLNKYTAGKVLTIAGSGGLPGAASLTARVVLKAGAGASILAFPKSVRNLIHKKLSEVVVQIYEDDRSENFIESAIEELEAKLNWADVVAIGPGLGRSETTQAAILKFLKRKRKYLLVIDADAIYALSNNKYKLLNLRNSILTPHHGEFSNLLGISVSELQKNIFNYGRNFSRSTKSILVLKGSPTIIFIPSGEVFINTVGNPGLAKFGSGDVLTGMIAGILAQHKNTEKAAIAAVYLHSLAADILKSVITEYSYSAEDLIKSIPKAIVFLRKSLEIIN